MAVKDPKTAPHSCMTTENAIRILAGTLVLVSVSLGHYVHPAWLLLATFVGLNLAQSALTGFCPAEIFLRKLGLTKDGGCSRPPEQR